MSIHFIPIDSKRSEGVWLGVTQKETSYQFKIGGLSNIFIKNIFCFEKYIIGSRNEIKLLDNFRET